MKRINLSDVHNHTKQCFDIVEAGVTVRVMRKGKPIADIVPVGLGLPTWKRRKVKPLVLKGISASAIILEERDSVI